MLTFSCRAAMLNDYTHQWHARRQQRRKQLLQGSQAVSILQSQRL